MTITNNLHTFIITVNDRFTNEFDGSTQDHSIVVLAQSAESLRKDIDDRINALVAEFDALAASITTENSRVTINKVYQFFEYGDASLINKEKYGTLLTQHFVNDNGYRFGKVERRLYYIQTAQEWFESNRVN